MKEIKVLFVVTGTERVAASRYRVFQYIPFLRSAGVECRIFSVISDYLTIQSIRSPEFGFLRRILYYALLFLERSVKFWKIFFISGGYDVLFFSAGDIPLFHGEAACVEK